MFTSVLLLAKLSTMTVASPPPGVVRLPAPKTDNVVLPDGTLSVTCVVQSHVPAGIFTVVVEATTLLKAFCTSVCEQDGALIICARPSEGRRASKTKQASWRPRRTVNFSAVQRA